MFENNISTEKHMISTDRGRDIHIALIDLENLTATLKNSVAGVRSDGSLRADEVLIEIIHERVRSLIAQLEG